MRHIALLVPSLGGGGAERSMFNLARGLIEGGYRVDLLVCRATGHLRDELPAGGRIVFLGRASQWRGRLTALRADPAGFRVAARPMLLPFKAPWAVRYLPGLVGYLRRERPDVLLAGVSFFNIVALWARRRAGVATRVIATERSSLSANIAARPGQWRRQFLPPLVRRAYGWADAIVAVSNGTADDLAATADIPRDRIATIYNPVVTPDLVEQAEAAVHHPWLAPGAPPVVLGVGRLVPEKDFPTLIEAFARVRAEREAHLIILGKGKPARRAALQALTETLNVADAVDFPGWVANPFAYMSRASAFVLSSRHEGLPGTLIQALACGCPVVSTDCVGGAREILQDGAYGPLVPVGDADALAEAILAILATPPDRARLRARAAEFSIERAVARYLDVFRTAGGA